MDKGESKIWMEDKRNVKDENWRIFERSIDLDREELLWLFLFLGMKKKKKMSNTKIGWNSMVFEIGRIY